MPGAAPYAPTGDGGGARLSRAAAPRVPPSPIRRPRFLLRRLLWAGRRDGSRRGPCRCRRRDVGRDRHAPVRQILREQAALFQRTNGPSAERDGRGILVIYSTIYGIWPASPSTSSGRSTTRARPLRAAAWSMGVGLRLLLLGLTNDRPGRCRPGRSTPASTTACSTALPPGAWGFGAQHRRHGVRDRRRGRRGRTARRHSTPPSPARRRRGRALRAPVYSVGGLLGVANLAPDSSSKMASAPARRRGDGPWAIAGLALSRHRSRCRARVISSSTRARWAVASPGSASPQARHGSERQRRAVAAGGLAGMTAGHDRDDLPLRATWTWVEDDERAPVACPRARRPGRWRWGTPGATPQFDGLGRRVLGATFTAVGGTF